MGFFWFWIIRAPFAALAVLFLLGGTLSIIDWPLTSAGLALFGFIADGAHHLGHHVRRREAAARRALELLEEPPVVRGRFIAQRSSDESRAA
jgi:hypothetical protein